jgi:circadian clock protein KaiC
MLTGSARNTFQIRQSAEEFKKQKELERRDREIERKKKILESNIAAMRTEFESTAEELSKLRLEEQELNSKLNLKSNTGSKKTKKR